MLSQTKNKIAKNTYKTRRWLGTCYLTLTHKKKKIVSCFVVQGGSSAVLGMPDIDSLGVLTINCEKIGRQAASDENTEQ